MMIVTMIANPFSIVLFILLVFAIFFLIRHIIACCREAKRTELAMRSPLLTLITN